jgi:sigma-B regulation protein RsbU (phosphoserine phosphatase)
MPLCVRRARFGGDFYDFFLIDERRLCVLISDVSGKGVPAALFMAVSKALLKATALSGLPLTQVMHKVNDELCEEADGGMFVTLLVAILDTATGEIEYSNAGHTSPFLLASDGVVSPLDGGHSPALALAAGLDFPWPNTVSALRTPSSSLRWRDRSAEPLARVL